ncbi:MerR family transcriptional regulator [Nocardia gipuzkoensis]|uniref:MerR family transcriptional regulator n=1 Tax=Nocardia gipuzkoensis TaxID=2749991 RepID=UPI001E5F30BA|nr:MerR family transcriptional regulator [Nocardia gipuzkoensis]UGT67315.1 MerR family transcriptional regulator [Nocardia gipuzkoensis]
MTENTHRDGLVSIGELSRSTGVPVRTLRFYCDEGILEAERSTGGHRLFDSVSAVDRVLLLRRLRTLGLSLSAITDVLSGDTSIAAAVAAERAALNTELRTLAWRRASLLAVEDAPPAERTARLELLAAVQDRHHAHDRLVKFWRRLLAPLPSAIFDGFVAMNIPDLPADPPPRQVVAYAELTARITDPALTAAMSRQLWRTDPTGIHDKRALVTGVAEVCETVDALVAARCAPHPGPELDQFVDVHATARRERDTPRLRHRLLHDAVDTHPAIHRYWELTTEITGTTTSGAAQYWLYRALARGTDPAARYR